MPFNIPLYGVGFSQSAESRIRKSQRCGLFPFDAETCDNLIRDTARLCIDIGGRRETFRKRDLEWIVTLTRGSGIVSGYRGREEREEILTSGMKSNPSSSSSST